MGGNGNLGSVTKRFCLICSPGSAIFEPCLGAGHGKAGAVRREMQTLPGKPGSPLNGAWGLGGLGLLDIILCARHPRVRSCCQSASFHGTIGGKRWGEAMRVCGVRGRDDLLLQQTLSEFQETFNLNKRQSFLSKHPLGVRKNTEILFLQE